jgi:hypothetical protein
MAHDQHRREACRAGNIIGQRHRVVDVKPETVEACVDVERAGIVAVIGKDRHPEGKLLIG